MEYETIIGLEVHLQLSTQSKAFCGCSTKFGQTPNTLTCPVCLGFPGSLPVLNKRALEYAIKVALALNCKIQEFVKFDRKNYFYPDLPKNFQISQYDLVLSKDGFLQVQTKDGCVKTIDIRRVHMEEDAGKLIHEPEKNLSLVDFNRSGIPLLEIVSEPDINSPSEAYEYLVTLKNLLKYLDVSDCNMEEGSLRCDANISLRRKGESELGTKAELKNMNSFKAVKSALEAEQTRQTEILKSGKKVIQQTRLWDEKRQITEPMRTKEEAHDYRYFPEPDLVPFIISKEYIDLIQDELPELPGQKLSRFVSEYQLSGYDAGVLTSEKSLADYFEECVKMYNKPKIVANWLMGDFIAYLNEKNLQIKDVALTAKKLVDMLRLIEDGTISGKIAKDVLIEMLQTQKTPDEIVKEKGLVQITDPSAIEEVIARVINENTKVVSQYKSGKQQALIFLVGCVMKHTKGKANPQIVNEILKKKLGD